MSAPKTLLPSIKYVGFIRTEAEAIRDKIVAKGGIAWLEDDVSSVHGHQEWVGFTLYWITWKRLSNHVDRVRGAK